MKPIIDEIFELEIYKSKVRVVLIPKGTKGKDMKELAEWQGRKKLNLGASTLGMVSWGNTSGHYVLAVVEGENNIPLVAHEVFHLTHTITRMLNCTFAAAYDEPFALLHEFLMKKVCSILKPNVFWHDANHESQAVLRAGSLPDDQAPARERDPGDAGG